jgi:hypothetical protein
MINVSKGRNENQKNLAVFLPNQKTFNKGIKLLLEMHSLLHDKKVYKTAVETFYDNLWEDMKDETCRVISDKETSILWDIWHITRIEDIVSNIIIGNKETIFNNEIQAKLNIRTKDTGNAMTHSEIESLNKNINIKELNGYRVKVGKSTQKIMSTFP